MSRVRLVSINPKTFFDEIQRTTSYSFTNLAEICDVHRRCFSDWKNGKTLMPQKVFQKLSKFLIAQPHYELLKDYWHIQEAARKGAQKKLQLYGPPGTPAGRRKGGLRTQELFRSNPEFAARVGFKVRKTIFFPQRSVELAELIGILLGDGGLSRYQVTVTLNSIDDADYVGYVKNLLTKLFEIDASLLASKHDKGIDIRVSSRELVEYMIKNHGLAIGDKLRARVTIPKWIERNTAFLKSCLRGLYDTDGSFYIDYHNIHGIIYAYPCLAFTSHNPTLYGAVRRALDVFGFHPTGKRGNLFLRIEQEVHQYFMAIGTSNAKHLEKYKKFVKNRIHSGGVREMA